MTRAVLAVLLLPGVIAFAVPLFIAWPSARQGAFAAIAIGPLLAGTALLLWSVREFHLTGKGTLAPWSPPRRLVTSGPYRLSRNPMYIGVSLVLAGWAVAFRSWPLVVYAAVVIVAFHLRVVYAEERWLAGTHGNAWRPYAAGTPRWMFPTRRAFITTCVAVLIALPLAGAIFEVIADAGAAREFPPPGEMVDIGGRRLHLLCIGDDGPVVLFEASGWGSAISFAAARDRLSRRMRVCSYDRRGKGWSDPAPGPATAGALARDLGVLQDRAKLRGPLVIVASSIGGLTAEMFARQFPERVAGLVFVDAASSLTLPLLTSRAPTVTALACTANGLAHLGVIRLLDPFRLGNDTDSARRGAAITYNARSWGHMCAMARGLDVSANEFQAAPPLQGDMPLTVLSASSSSGLLPPGLERVIDAEEVRAALVESHQRLAKQSTRGAWRMVPESTHLIGSSQPDAVADAVFDLLDERR